MKSSCRKHNICVT